MSSSKSQVTRPCSRCAAVLSARARFCSECGEPAGGRNLGDTVVSSRQALRWLDSGLELVVRGPAGEQVESLGQEQLRIGSLPDSDLVLTGRGVHPRHLTLFLREGELFLASPQGARVNGQSRVYRRWRPGDEVVVGPYRLQIRGLQVEMGRLVGLTPPYAGRCWPLGPTTRLGRSGRRTNEVELEDATVSREHATLAQTETGFLLTVEGQGPTRVEGRPVTQTRLVRHRERIQLGQQLVRLEDLRVPVRPVTLLRLEAPARALGSLLDRLQGVPVLPSLEGEVTALLAVPDEALRLAAEVVGPEWRAGLVAAEVGDSPTLGQVAAERAQARRLGTLAPGRPVVDSATHTCLAERFPLQPLPGREGYQLKR